MLEKIYAFTGLPEREQASLRWYYASLSAEGAIEVHRRQVKILKARRGALRAAELEVAEMHYCALLLALDAWKRLSGKLSRKAEDMEAIEEVVEARHGTVPKGRRKRPAKKLERLRKELFGVVETLRKDDTTWGGVVRELRRRHHVRFSPRYLQRCYAQIAADRAKAEPDAPSETES